MLAHPVTPKGHEIFGLGDVFQCIPPFFFIVSILRWLFDFIRTKTLWRFLCVNQQPTCRKSTGSGAGWGSEAAEKTLGERTACFSWPPSPPLAQLWTSSLAHDLRSTCACFGRHLVRQVVGMFERLLPTSGAWLRAGGGKAAAEEPVGSVFAVPHYSNQMRRITKKRSQWFTFPNNGITFRVVKTVCCEQ